MTVQEAIAILKQLPPAERMPIVEALIAETRREIDEDSAPEQPAGAQRQGLLALSGVARSDATDVSSNKYKYVTESLERKSHPNKP